VSDTETPADDGTETYTEWRLSGQPPGDYPFYDLTFHDRERVEHLKAIFAKSSERGWTDAKLRSRQVTIIRTPWQEES
jgi:hypothetical protein